MTQLYVNIDDNYYLVVVYFCENLCMYEKCHTKG